MACGTIALACLMIKTADGPVFVIGRTRFCALHAGWRGLVGEILLRGVKDLLAPGRERLRPAGLHRPTHQLQKL